MKQVYVIGAGLAGSEAAWQIAQAGVPVTLYEMKPLQKTPAHSLDTFAELVCSNSLRGDALTNAVGLLKEELRLLDSLIMQCADATRLPAGGALAVDRLGFTNLVTEKIKQHPNITVVAEEITSLDQFSEDAIVVVATGPLTTDALFSDCAKRFGKEYLYFYDAAAPIVSFDTIDMSKAYRGSRYGKGTDDYINCPMNKEEYLAFYQALVEAETVPLKIFEDEKHFEGCMPIETMAGRGVDTMRFGPLKPVGLPDPRTGKDPYAVVQLRQDNKEGTLYNIVGFQTHLKFPEQKRVFGMIPGLEQAEFVRYGVMHRNTYINSPGLLKDTYQTQFREGLFFAGQMTGVEGYVESTSSGYVAGINAARLAKGEPLVQFPVSTAIGALANYISTYAGKNFQPMNVNYGIIESKVPHCRDKKARYLQIAEEALATVRAWKESNEEE